MNDVFLCYRSNDNPQTAWRLWYILNEKNGYKTFLDKYIHPGHRWDKTIEANIRSCTIFICLIGENWLEVGANGISRIHDKNDIVRQEIALAIDLKKRILPIVVGDAKFPKENEHPFRDERFTKSNYIPLQYIPPQFDHDAKKVCEAVGRLMGEELGPIYLVKNATYRFLRNKYVRFLSILALSAMAMYLYMSTPPSFKPIDRYDEIVTRGSDGNSPWVSIGFREYSFPVSYKDEQGESGFMVEACKEIVRKFFPANLKPETLAVISGKTSRTEFNRIDSILDGKIDIECGSTSITDD